MNSPLQNPQHECFAHLYAAGLTATKACVSSGYPEQGASPAASRLLGTPEVRARVTGLQEARAYRVVREAAAERAQVLAKLDTARQQAEKKGDYGAAIRALELLGRELGMFRDAVEVRIEPRE